MYALPEKQEDTEYITRVLENLGKCVDSGCVELDV